DGAHHVISLTKLNGTEFVVNADLIKTVETTPDTIITLINGDRLMVRESVRDVVERAIDFGRRLRTMRPRD
ncbi:MAG: flagellar FlbD family protein, partial [Planctomycetota bacterium]